MSPSPACEQYLSQTGFEEPNVLQLGRLRPCNYCFPDGEITVPTGDLLVSDAKRPNVVHRHEETGELELDDSQQPTNPGRFGLSHTLEELEPDDVEPLAGGDA